jgi:hypothetical protein
MCLFTKLASLHHVYKSRLELESIVSYIGFWSSTDVGGDWSKEFMKSLVSHGFNF